MKRLQLLKALVTIAFVLLMISLIFGLPFILILVIAPEQVPFTFSGRWNPVLMLSFLYIVYGIITYGVYQFKTTLDLFSKKIFFDERVIRSLHHTGLSFIAAALLSIILPFLYTMFVLGEFEVTAGFSSGSPLFTLGLGLFFIVLAEVFANAKRLKEENDLTV